MMPDTHFKDESFAHHILSCDQCSLTFHDHVLTGLTCEYCGGEIQPQTEFWSIRCGLLNPPRIRLIHTRCYAYILASRVKRDMHTAMQEFKDRLKGVVHNDVL